MSVQCSIVHFDAGFKVEQSTTQAMNDGVPASIEKRGTGCHDLLHWFEACQGLLTHKLSLGEEDPSAALKFMLIIVQH